MESMQSCSTILTKFGILSCLLPYYGGFVHWQFLMKHACKKSRKTWQSYASEFKYIFEQMQPLQIVKQNDGLLYFNEATFTAILETKAYCNYPLRLCLSRHDSYSWLLELLNLLFDRNDIDKGQVGMIDEIQAFDIITNLQAYKEIGELVMKMGNPASCIKSSLFLNTEKYYDLWKGNKVYLHTLVLTVFDRESEYCHDLDEIFNLMFGGIRRLAVDFSGCKSILQAAKYLKEEIHEQKALESNIFSKIEEYEIDLTCIQVENIHDLMYLLNVLQPKSKLCLKGHEIHSVVLLDIIMNIQIKNLDIVYTGFDRLRESGNYEILLIN